MDNDSTGRYIICGGETVSGLEGWSKALYFAVFGCDQRMYFDVVAARLRRARTSLATVQDMQPDQVCCRTLESVETDLDRLWLPPTKLGGFR